MRAVVLPDYGPPSALVLRDIPNRDAFVLRAYQLIAYARAHVASAD